MLEDDPISTEPGAALTKVAPATKRRKRGIDPSTVGVGALIALAGGGLYYMHAQTAEAVMMVSQADQRAASIEAMLAGGREGLNSLARDVEATRATIDRFTKRDNATLAVARSDDRDPFAFRSLEPKVTAATPTVSTNNVAREAAKAKALAAAQRMQLQSIIYGTSRRACLIDGKLYFEGATAGDFTIARIAADAVQVQAGEFRFELRLRK